MLKLFHVILLGMIPLLAMACKNSPLEYNPVAYNPAEAKYILIFSLSHKQYTNNMPIQYFVNLQCVSKYNGEAMLLPPGIVYEFIVTNHEGKNTTWSRIFVIYSEIPAIM
jgi:hypothetical protein